LRRQGDYAVISVRDTGIGIRQEDCEKVFELFSQVRPGHMNPGLGIGLALVRQLVELHGGAVRVESEGSGKGSTFTVRLPLAAPSLGADLTQPL
jgi:signal transduction histidine kinase